MGGSLKGNSRTYREQSHQLRERARRRAHHFRSLLRAAPTVKESRPEYRVRLYPRAAGTFAQDSRTPYRGTARIGCIDRGCLPTSEGIDRSGPLPRPRLRSGKASLGRKGMAGARSRNVGISRAGTERGRRPGRFLRGGLRRTSFREGPRIGRRSALSKRITDASCASLDASFASLNEAAFAVLRRA